MDTFHHLYQIWATKRFCLNSFSPCENRLQSDFVIADFILFVYINARPIDKFLHRHIIDFGIV